MSRQIITRASRWAPKALFAIADQVIFSGAHLLLNIYLARVLEPEYYGSFAIVFSVFLMLSGAHNALILEPMSVFGSSLERGRLGVYLGQLMWLHVGLVSLLALICAGAAPLLRDSLVAASFAALPAAMPFLLLLWLLRRAFYMRSLPHLAFSLTGSYAILVLLGLLVLGRLNILSGFTALLLMGISALLASLLMWHRLGIPRSSLSLAHVNSLKVDVIPQHWRYGRWALGTAMVHSAGGAIYLPLIGYFAGLEAAGVFRGMQYLTLPVGQILAGMGLLMLPWAAARQSGMNRARLRRLIVVIASGFTAFAAAYVLALLLADQWVIEFLYNRPEYLSSSWIIPFLGVAAIFNAAAAGLTIPLRGAKRPYAEFYAQASKAILTLTVGLYLGSAMGLHGFAVSAVLAALAAALVLCQQSCRLIASRSSHSN